MKNYIGTKIYYCLITGNIIKIIGDQSGDVVETTLDEDYKIFIELKERERSTIGLLQYRYGEYSELSQNSTGCYFDLEKQELIFTYDTLPENPKKPSLEDKISILETGLANAEYSLMMGGLL